MNDTDSAKFHHAFLRLVAMLPRERPRDKDLKSVEESYFKVLLRKNSIDEVIAAGLTVAETFTKFPTAAEWLSAMSGHGAGQVADRREMTQAEAAMHRRAQELHYTDEPCACRHCVSAGVSDRPLRFVPDSRDDSRDERAIDPTTQREVIVGPGHWARGEELRKYYNARATASLPIRGHPAGRRLIPFTQHEQEGTA